MFPPPVNRGWLTSLGVLVVMLTFGTAAAETSARRADERIGWTDAKTDTVIACAARLRFTGLVARGKVEEMGTFCIKAKAAGLDVYYWITPNGPGQVMSAEDNAALAHILASKDCYAEGYQGGGEPLAGHHDVVTYHIPCFHRPETMSATKADLKRLTEDLPDLAGFAFDGFGYGNYRFCDCLISRQLLQEYQTKHPELSAEAARDQFSLKTLVGCYNDLADYARSMRLAIKTTCHVWPTFLPEPRYGNRLDLDSVQQTAAWFFKPFWTDDRIARYTKEIVGEQTRYHRRQLGIPFIGVGLNTGKDPDRVRHELRQIFSATEARSLGVYVFDELAANRAL